MSLWPTVESPKSFLLFGAMTQIGAMLGRSIWVNDDYRQLFPMMNVLLIGPSGTGKSTAAAIAGKLIKNLPENEQPLLIQGAVGTEKLHEELSTRNKAIIYASELANFFSKAKYLDNLIPYFTELLDYGEIIERRFKTTGLLQVRNAEVSILGCSTVEWLQDQLPETAVEGGFLARFLIVYEEHKAQSIALPGEMLSATRKAKLDFEREKIYAEFRRLVQVHSGQMTFKDWDARDTYTVWYGNHKPASGHLAPFAARAGAWVRRMAMILAVSCDRKAISVADIQSAIELYEWCSQKLQQVVVPFNQTGKMLAKVLEAVGTETVTDKQLKRAMRNFATSQDTLKFIDSLMASGELVRLPGGALRRTGL